MRQRSSRGHECGIRIEGYSEFEVGDQIECYSIEKSRRNYEALNCESCNVERFTFSDERFNN